MSTKLNPIMITLSNQNMDEHNIILGIDPGTTIMGFGLIKTTKRNELIQLHELQLKNMIIHFLKLQKIFNRTIEIIDEFHPEKLQLKLLFWKKCTVNVEIRKSPG